jgi:hypothetical protein
MCSATKGRTWLATQDLPQDEHQAVEALLRQLDWHPTGRGLLLVESLATRWAGAASPEGGKVVACVLDLAH